jgi:hypothetical protein
MTPSPATRLRLTDQARREWYITKVDFLAQDVPGGYRKGMRRELRSDLGAAAADVGMSQAVRNLGPAAVLAQQLKLAEGRKLPHPWTGVITFVILFYSWIGMLMATVNALTAAAAQLATDRTVTVHAAWLGSTVSVTHGEQLSGGVEFSVVTVAVMVIVPLIAARAWRYSPVWLQRRLATNRAGDQ